MTPVFNEFIEIVNKNNKNNIDLSWLKEGYFWYDMTIIKGFDKNLELKKIIKINIDNDLNFELCEYKDIIYDYNFLSWNEVYDKMSENINYLVKDSIDIIKNNFNANRRNIVLYSGGKDSVVCLDIVKKVFDNCEIAFSNTSLENAETYKHIKSINAKIMNPKVGFYQWVKKENIIPSRVMRSCCANFKELSLKKHYYARMPINWYMGMRNSESQNRKEYGDVWRNKSWGTSPWDAILPIRKWNDLDIWLYIIHNNLYISKKYKQGYPRLGCGIVCPYANKSSWVLDKEFYKVEYDRWRKFLKEHYYRFNKDLVYNCSADEYCNKYWNGTIDISEPKEEIIIDFANRNGLNIEIAREFFNKTCKECGCKVIRKEEIGMSIKLLGNNGVYYCKKCLCNRVGMDDSEWSRIVDKFKRVGCELF